MNDKGLVLRRNLTVGIGGIHEMKLTDLQSCSGAKLSTEVTNTDRLLSNVVGNRILVE